jgi:GTP-binding protein HflX
MGASAELLGGGIGTRGRAEIALEVDRRRVRKSIDDLEEELGQLQKQRDAPRPLDKKEGRSYVAWWATPTPENRRCSTR